MKIRVMLFAVAKQIAGAPEIELEFAAGPTVAEVRKALIQLCPDLADVMACCMFAVNNEYASMDQVISDDCEVGLIPPVSGG